MSRLQKFILGVSTMALPGLALAEGATPTDVHSAVTQLQTAATGAIDEVKPALVAIIVALFAIVGIVFAWNKLKARFGR